VRRGCGVHGNTWVVRVGSSGGTDPTGGTHEPARVGVRTATKADARGPQNKERACACAGKPAPTI
jgi:hypothetical protein